MGGDCVVWTMLVAGLVFLVVMAVEYAVVCNYVMYSPCAGSVDYDKAT